MKFNIITVMPELMMQTLQWGVVGRALEKNIFSVNVINPRQFTSNVHKTIDDTPFGGGDGMIMLYEPLAQAVESVEGFEKIPKYFMSPTGKKLDEKWVQDISNQKEIIILSGRYGGVDQRLLHKYNFISISIGDYVVSGGELPAGILIDAVARKLPGVLGNSESSSSDSFSKNGMFEAPSFTKPRENAGGKVPDVLTGGDHRKIIEFREQVGLALTLKWRPDLVPTLSKNDIQRLKNYLSTYDAETLQLLGLDREFVERLH
ncbi:MAG: tRNA (guanosine(37)-N1)-methyltransferase TrmD [Bdellovibrionales bacterium]|nr:tRNA (guanosine(37)-N1)-methyltransferase TrmD [Bdellovibrionales bacterium]